MTVALFSERKQHIVSNGSIGAVQPQHRQQSERNRPGVDPPVIHVLRLGLRALSSNKKGQVETVYLQSDPGLIGADAYSVLASECLDCLGLVLLQNSGPEIMAVDPVAIAGRRIADARVGLPQRTEVIDVSV